MSSKTNITDGDSMLPEFDSTFQEYFACSSDNPKPFCASSMIRRPPGWMAQKSMSLFWRLCFPKKDSTYPPMFFAMYCGRYFDKMQEIPFSLIDSVMPSSVPSMSQPCVSTMPNLPLALAEPGFSPEITAAAQPFAKIAWRIASFTLSSNVVCTLEISTQTINASLPGWDAA